MKRRETDPQLFALVRMLDEFALREGVSISHEGTQDRLLESLSRALETHRSHEARLHGFRVEAMFAHVAGCHWRAASENCRRRWPAIRLASSLNNEASSLR